MIGVRRLPPDFHAWNERYGAPFGRPDPNRWVKRLLTWSMLQRHRGPFSFQPNNTLRTFEYPWAYGVVPIEPGMRVLEIGGGLGGFQFVLDGMKCHVVNVDPGMEANGVGWQCDPERMATLNKLFGASVELRNTTIEKAGLESESFDCAYSISVIEHLPDGEISDVMQHVYRVLKPGGFFVLTVDLFLNLQPFTSRESNEYGRNIDVRALAESAPFRLSTGDRAELYGYPEFDKDRIQSQLERYFVGVYPALTQCLVLQKPASKAS
ncbi:MAG TPA: class I SAM-dependent methyltransferase [Myxococcota bacterium]|nr:class I SAM-dependent methyltransferase [Myxococcota bacterium]